MAQFLTTLKNESIDDEGEKKRLVSPLEYQSDLIGFLSVPAGFTHDGESVERWPLVYMLFKGVAERAAVVHDYLYSTGQVGRETADRVFLEAMEATGVSWWRRKLMYRAVRVFGGRHFRGKDGTSR